MSGGGGSEGGKDVSDTTGCGANVNPAVAKVWTEATGQGIADVREYSIIVGYCSYGWQVKFPVNVVQCLTSRRTAQTNSVVAE